MFAFFKKIFGPKNEEDKRREKRFRVGDDFSLKFKHAHSKDFHFVSPRDLSVHGVRFATLVPAEVGDDLELHFFFSRMFQEATTLVIKAKVIRTNRPRGAKRTRIGCEFIHESDQSRDILERFIEFLKS